MTLPIGYFDDLYAAAQDPWRYRQRWYEQRKRDLCLAALPHARYARGYEPGCSIGELSAALAERCDALLVSDGSAAAVARARERLEGEAQVHVEQRLLPQQWPDERFELIVFSEIGYYFDAAQLQRLLDSLWASLASDGVLLACHWRHPIEGCSLDGDAVHRAIENQLGLPRLAHHEEEDFLLDVWARDATSVARREGLA